MFFDSSGVVDLAAGVMEIKPVFGTHGMGGGGQAGAAGITNRAWR